MTEIVSITIDSPVIDRRILLFARSLKSADYNVRILAPSAEVENGFEDIEIVNVVQLLPPAPPAPPAGKLKNILKRILLRNRFGRTFVHTCFLIYNQIQGRRSTQHFWSPYWDSLTQAAQKMKVDICIANDLVTLPVGCALKERTGCCLVYDAHEFYSGQISLSRGQSKFFKKLESRLIGNADLVITVNDDIADLLKNTYGVEDVAVILNATTPNSLEINYLHDMLKVSRSKKIVLYQGVFTDGRNLHDLVEIASHLKNGIIVLLGWGELREPLMKTASELNILDKKIFFLDRLSQQDLLSYTASAALGIIPYPPVDINTTYCTPNKLFEFISARVPILANEGLVTVKRFIDKYGIGITSSFRDAESIALKIDDILGDNERLNSFRKNLDVANKELDWENESNKLKSIFGLSSIRSFGCRNSCI